ncbi:MAG: UDP-N-acetylmuramoylalanyl-D-glutamyl-2,6-diaminopimelate--D-alanyl-D-alanine ligase [Rhodospirillaceae bacterium]|jgi:UDP-N-acetylmuramoyl-tripeptide--D-alanyl-D-alanine ligase|nr:UDP-N-acetylmuramoylalanyl-D-glutamyl-2,6-diaminopimelate--D-alanyl-D-alanine ligase [Rhodospirillaceae bacterium]
MTEALWTAAAAAAATRGTATGNWTANGVTIDSRQVELDDLFIAISGPNHDGHAFAVDALAKGAAAVVVQEGKSSGLDAAKVLRVADTMTALEDLARAARDRSTARIAAITGSVGKTGTKEALRLALQAQPGAAGSVTATEGNLNNHWGLPLSLARMPEATRFGIFEMGMSSGGEISPLSRMARPHVALITTVAHSHSEFFEGLEQIADAKAEIFDGLTEDGTAVLNRDNAMYAHLLAAARKAGATNIVTFGANAEADCRLLDVELHSQHSDIKAEINGRSIAYTLGVPGRHLALNSLGVLVAAQALGADVEQAARALKEMRGLAGRGERHQIALHHQGIEWTSFDLIDESYNASPASMTAAISVLTGSKPALGGRRIAVLGDMLELGSKAEMLHAALVAPLAEGGIDKVFTAGRYMSSLWDALPNDMRAGHATTADALAPMVTAFIRPGDVVMVKGSLGSRTGQIVEALKNIPNAAGNDAAPRVVNGG